MGAHKGESLGQGYGQSLGQGYGPVLLQISQHDEGLWTGMEGPRTTGMYIEKCKHEPKLCTLLENLTDDATAELFVTKVSTISL